MTDKTTHRIAHKMVNKLSNLKKGSLHKVDYDLFRNKLKQTVVKRVKNHPTKTLMYDLNNNIQAVLFKAAINEAGETIPPQYFISLND